MVKPIVVLDLETTGLDPARDAIIEIGAIKFKGDRTEGEFSTLINPGRKLTPFITQLTGITDAMLVNAPRISAILPHLEEFVGDAAVLGHNIKFDLGFMHARQTLRYADGLDTWDMASVLLPTASRYNLGSLAKELGIVLPATHQHHRALDDCRETLGVYRALCQKALELPLDVLAEIVHLGEDVEWGAGLVFEEALRARSKEVAGPRRARASAGGPLWGDVRPLQPRDEIVPLDPDELAALLEQAGPFSKHFPNYEFRAEQVQMLRGVARALSDGRHLLVEAGTGTGKSVAYLIPAAQWALQNGERVVISTNTINLQDQLIHKDIPDLQQALGLDFRACVLKGRSHYLCPRRLENMRRYRPKTGAEMRVLAKVLVWLQSAEEYSDLAEISLSGPEERAAWLRLSAEDEGCTGETCQTRMGGACPFYRAHKAAEAAHIIIVNHALLLADIAAENRVLPDYNYLVVDEAHHLEEATTDGLSFHIGRPDVERQLRDLGGPTAGLLGQLCANTRGVLPPDSYVMLEREVEYAYDRATLALDQLTAFFAAIENFLEAQREGQPMSEYAQQVRILPATRKLLEWEAVETSWDELGQTLTALTDSIGRLARGLAELQDYDIPEKDDLISATGAAARRLETIDTNLTGLVFKPDAMMIYWAETHSERVSLHAAPLHVGPLIQKHLWHAKQAVVMTSATLTTAGEFDYLKSRLQAAEADELAVGSPFDYENSTLLYLVNDIPEPFDKVGYQKAVEAGLTGLCKATHGRALVLFTSYAQLKQTAQAIRDPLARAGIEVYDQADGTSRTALLDSFKASEGGVLLGTKSFWEGVDVPGQALSALVIVKLPFDVPSDPIIAARSESFERPFDEYTVPEAVLKFRQGFGRLIRTKSDRGVVAVFDRRVLSKNYGRIFLESLPACTVKSAPLAQLAREAVKWIDGG
jgi:ATP-dependent DNA helicase DinG